MTNAAFDSILAGLDAGDVVPYLGADALRGVSGVADGQPIPADSDSLILAMNNGRPMAPKLMYEFPRAAMNLELKKGRKFITRFLTKLYGETEWTVSELHRWLAGRELPYIVDINRDLQLQNLYSGRPHTLILGVARIGGTEYRFKLFHSDGTAYREVSLDEVDTSLPVLFKPHGSPQPEANYIASDADFVDYITELMGGFSIPPFLKQQRKDKRYLLLGMRLLRDTQRMVLSDIIYDAARPSGWVLIPEPTAKERRFCEKRGLSVVEADWSDLIEYAATTSAAA
ncbi:SIR2 family protein [Endothiovibrio diazotrophicus]